MKRSQGDGYNPEHYASLAVILLGGMTLRFIQLEAKPLWLDEVITALFSLGRSYTQVPLDVSVALIQLTQVFTYQAGQSWAEIAYRVATESVHPPLFFCLSYLWMGWFSFTSHWVWALRALPALLGVGAIAAVYLLNRVGFSVPAGLAAAALMAVSPFAVYLSQEARHYTLPMGLIGLGLVSLVQMQQDLQQQRVRLWVWLSWVGAGVLGLYTHYLVVLAIAAQVGALITWMVYSQSRRWQDWGALGLAISAIGVAYLPWFPSFLSHMSRPETDWLRPYEPTWVERLSPIAQMIGNWAVMVVALPVEGQPWAIALPAVALMLLGCLWLSRLVLRGWRSRWHSPQRPALFLLTGFVAIALLEFLAIVYGLDKDITVVPRYNFVYYPAVCALLGACLTQQSDKLPNPRRFMTFAPWLSRSLALTLGMGLVSSLFVGYGVVFQKAYYPDRVAQTIYHDASLPLMVVVSYRSLQEVALGLSFALELDKLAQISPAQTPIEVAFINSQKSDRQVWRAIPQLRHELSLPINLWIVANSSVRKRSFPKELRLFNPAQPNARGRGLCNLDPNQTHRLGFPYQGYRCE